MNLLIISSFFPYESVGHAGGKTVFYYANKFTEDFEVKLCPIVTKEDFKYIKKDNKYDLDPILYGYRLIDKISRRILTIYSKYSLNNKYCNFCNEYDIKILKNKLNELSRKKYIPDVVILEWTQSVLLYEIIKKYYPKSKIIASEHDLTYIGIKRKITESVIKTSKHKYEKFKKLEQNAILSCDYTVFHSHADYERIKNDIQIGISNIGTIVPYYDNYSSLNWMPVNNDILFFGAMNRIENVNSVLWFYENVFKFLNRKNQRFIVLGSHPDPKLLLLAQHDKNVIVTGYVKNVEPYFEKCACIVAPLIMGAGIKVKVLEAMSAGIPVLTNKIGIEGIGANSEQDFFYCETANDYLKVLNDKILVDNKKSLTSLSKNAKNFIKNNFNLEDSYMHYKEKIISILNNN